LINASQVAMAAVAGVILFAEPVTASLVIGIALTIAGLMILATRRGIRIKRL
jgi:multidrug transporter EmrE-like cation transporter